MSASILFTNLSIIVAVGLIGPLLWLWPGLKIPAVLVELTAGAVIGDTGFRIVDANSGVFPSLYALGFAMLMLQAGTHVDINSPTLRRGFARGVVVFAIVLVIAIAAGFGLAAMLGINRPLLLVVLLAGSSAAVAYPIIEEQRLGGGGIEMLVAWIAVADSVTVVLLPLTLPGQTSLLSALLGDAAVIALGVVLMWLLLQLRHKISVAHARQRSIKRNWALEMRLSLLLLLVLSAIATRAGASTLLAGFVCGVVLVRLHESNRLEVQLVGMGNGFFVPLFFVLLGARLDVRSLFTSPEAIYLMLGMAALAVVIHVVAALLAASSSPRYAYGLASSAQLGLPAAAATLALTSHTLPPAYAAALVAAGCLTLIPATIGSGILASALATKTRTKP